MVQSDFLVDRETLELRSFVALEPFSEGANVMISNFAGRQLLTSLEHINDTVAPLQMPLFDDTEVELPAYVKLRHGLLQLLREPLQHGCIVFKHFRCRDALPGPCR